MGADLPPRAARPDLDLEPGAPAARTARVRAVLQRPPAAPGNRQRPATARTALTHHRAWRRHPASRPQTRPPRRHPPRVPDGRLTCTDEIFGKHNGRHEVSGMTVFLVDDSSTGDLIAFRAATRQITSL